MDVNRCVCCGDIIPEGRMVCLNCEAKVDTLKESSKMSYQETDSNYCKQCFVKIKKPSKKSIKKMILTEYKDRCENCGRIERLVEYTWENDEDEAE